MVEPIKQDPNAGMTVDATGNWIRQTVPQSTPNQVTSPAQPTQKVQPTTQPAPKPTIYTPQQLSQMGKMQDPVTGQIFDLPKKPATDQINEEAKKTQQILQQVSPTGQPVDSSVARTVSQGVSDTSTETVSSAQAELDKLKTLYETQPPATVNIQDYYNQLATSQGLPEIDTKIVNLENVMNGTEQDIRNEIQSGGGLATESQVQALVGARNNALTIQLNSLLNLRQQRSDYINNQVNLKQSDAKTAADNFDKQIGYQEKVATLQNTINNSDFKNTLAYQTYQQKEQAAGMKVLDSMNKQGALGNLDPDTLKWLSDTTGIPESLISKAGTNAASAMNLKLTTLQNKLSTNNGFGSVDNMAQAVISGNLAPSQLPGYGQNSIRSQVLSKIYQTNPNFDVRSADASFAFQKSQKSNMIQASINSANYAATKVIDLSDKVDRTDIQPINSALLQFKSKTGDANTSNFLGAVKIIGDEYGAVFGQGAATDFKAQLGLAIVDPSYSKEQFKSILNDMVIPLMQARLKAIQDQGNGTTVINDLNDPSKINTSTPSQADLDYVNSLK